MKRDWLLVESPPVELLRHLANPVKPYGAKMNQPLVKEIIDLTIIYDWLDSEANMKKEAEHIRALIITLVLSLKYDFGIQPSQ